MKSRIVALGFLFVWIPMIAAVSWAGDEPTSGDAASPSDRGSGAEGVPADWWSQVQKHIGDSEYHVTWQDRTAIDDIDAAWQAPNRSQNLRTYFTGEGIRVVPRTGEPAAWEWGLSLIGYVATRALGTDRGVILTALSGGLVSSTAVFVLCVSVEKP